MVNYRRNLVPGGTYFFTVALAHRRSSALVENVDALRAAFKKTRGEKPFEIDAIIILPEQLHAIITLPAADCDYADDEAGPTMCAVLDQLHAPRNRPFPELVPLMHWFEALHQAAETQGGILVSRPLPRQTY